MYIANNVKAIPRPNIKFHLELVESCWVQIDACKNNKTLIIGCIYKHPTYNLVQFCNQLSYLLPVTYPPRAMWHIGPPTKLSMSVCLLQRPAPHPTNPIFFLSSPSLRSFSTLSLIIEGLLVWLLMQLL